MMATKTAYPAPLTSVGQPMSAGLNPPLTSRRVLAPTSSNHGHVASPTESEFSDMYDAPETVRSWDEKSVADWLKSINCGQYEPIFRANHFNGENLLECDQAVLKELGIKKIGDRMRIFVGIKTLRTQAYGVQRKRNRDSFAALDNPSYTPPSSASPRPHGTARDRAQAVPASRRYSRPVDNYNLGSAGLYNKSSSRPDSPRAEGDSSHRLQASSKYAGMSPMDVSSRDYGSGYFSNSNPSSANTTTGRVPQDPPLTARAIGHSRQSPSGNGSGMGPLPQKLHGIRVISEGNTRVVKAANWKTAEDFVRSTLRKFGLQEDRVKNYCFYVLDGLDPDPANCRRISDAELVRICSSSSRSERNRLILRKIHAGEPSDEELHRASEIAHEERDLALQQGIAKTNPRSQLKLQKLTGEPWKAIQGPRSPTSAISPTERTRNHGTAIRDLEGHPDEADPRATPRQPPSHLRAFPSFLGQRPPSELISSDLATYFPDHEKEDIEKTVRMSIRRSQRLSRATSRLSMASNISFASVLKDAPPIPSIAESWLNGGGPSQRTPRPLSIVRMGNSSYRDSVASSMLEPLQEESPLENRKSYVSFDSGSDSALTNDQSIDLEPRNVHSYYDESSTSTPEQDPAATDSLNNSLTQALEEDGEEKDEELTSFLNGDSWDDMKYMKGRLIGQGSFGNVYLALHSITGELMAVKQVEVPSKSNSQMDNKKRTMVDALKREIGLLKSFQHENIVQYLGSSSDEEHLNIFLEYVPGGSVAQMLNSYGPQHEPLIRNFVRQILTGLNYLHEREIIHRDIKGANVLVDNKGCVKISDFGISKRVEATSALNKGAGNHANRPSLQGSVFWMAPEVVKQTSYTRKADIWSLGCLVVEMFTGNHPYPDCSQLQAIFKIGNSKATPTLPEKASPEAVVFLNQTFEIDHNLRPDASTLLESPFLKPTA